MKTIKLPIEYLNMEDMEILQEYTRLQNNVIRIAYNRFREKLSEKEIRLFLKTMNLHSESISIDSWFIQSGIYKAKEMYSKDLEYSKSNGIFPKRIFGGKSNLIKYSKKLISKEEFKNNKLLPLLIIGEAPKSGNRKFNFTNTSLIEFKPYKNCKINIQFPKLRKNLKSELESLIKFSNSNEIPYQIQLSDKFIWITFDNLKLEDLEKENTYSPIKNRYCGIDLNPNFIGFSVKENDKIIHTEEIDLKNLTGKNINYDKLNHETIEIFHYIGRKLKSLNVEYIFLEDLNFKNGNKGYGKRFNRLTINQWNKNLPFEILSKYFKNKIFKVNAAYSSTIGNCLYNYSDPINASLEIGRRGFDVIILKNKEGVSSFYPEFDLNTIRDELRKQTAGLELKTWKELHTFLKNSKLKYRVSWDEAITLHKVFCRKFYSKKSKVIINYIKCNSFI